MARYIGPDGRLIEKTTKQTDRKKAQAAAETLELAARKAKAGELTQAAILKCMGELLERTTGEKLNTATVRTFFAVWMRSKETVGRSNNTIKRYRPVLDEFLQHIGEKRATASIGSITPGEVERFRDNQLEEGKGGTTVNYEIRLLSSVFESARRKGASLSNPVQAVELLDAEAEYRLPFTEEQTRDLLMAARGTEWTGMILLGWNTGIRISDAANLTWGNIDLSTGLLSFVEQKTAKRRKGRKKETVVYLHKDVQLWLKTFPEAHHHKAPLFPGLHGGTSGSHGGLSNAFDTIMTQAGIRQPATRPGTPKRTGKGRTVRPFVFHSFRHSFVSRLANAAVPADVRKSCTGHTSDEAHEGYVHIAPEIQRQAIESLSSLGPLPS